MNNEAVRGERALLWAIVERAILDVFGIGLFGEKSKVRNQRKTAWRWIRSLDDDEFSFEWIAITLGFDPHIIRELVGDKYIGPCDDMRAKYVSTIGKFTHFEVHELLSTKDADSHDDDEYYTINR